jgi:hypothetical protein
MPIRINLLAEAQAAEDLRRRDPIKRLIAIGLLAVAGMLVWGSALQLKVMMANRDLTAAQFEIDTSTNLYEMAVTNNMLIAAGKMKLVELKKLANARMLQANLLNALQKVSVDNVQLMHLKVDQQFVPNTQHGKTDSITEKTVVTLDARDSSANPGDQVAKFKAALAAQSYFKDMLDRTNGIRLADESAPQQDNDGKNYVSFQLQCYFPDKIR